MVKLSDLEKYAKPILSALLGDDKKLPHLKLGDIDLIKREDKNGVVKEIRTIKSLSVFGKRAIVELAIPGSEGNVFQDMGRNPTIITLDGELLGPNAVGILQELKKKFETKKPVPFSSDVALVSDIKSVIFENFTVHFTGGVNLGVQYSMILKEHASASKGGKTGSGETEKEPPSQEKGAGNEIKDKIKQAYEKIVK
jgi:hypothetical protein